MSAGYISRAARLPTTAPTWPPDTSSVALSVLPTRSSSAVAASGGQIASRLAVITVDGSRPQRHKTLTWFGKKGGALVQEEATPLWDDVAAFDVTKLAKLPAEILPPLQLFSGIEDADDRRLSCRLRGRSHPAQREGRREERRKRLPSQHRAPSST